MSSKANTRNQCKRNAALALFGAALTAGMLLVAAIVWNAEERNEPLALSFQRYGVGPDGRSPVAVLWFTNASANPFQLMMTGTTNGLARDGSVLVSFDFKDKQASGWTRVRHVGGRSTAPLIVQLHSGQAIRVPLKESGEVRRVAVWAGELPRRLPSPLEKARRLWWLSKPPRFKMLLVWCEHDLACPKEVTH